jgi:RNA polymerase sigma-70 factor (ECF subfamily)
VIQQLGQYTWQVGGFYPWLRTLAFRIAIDLLRKDKRTLLFSHDDLTRELDAEHDGAHGDCELLAREDARRAREKVRAALERINPRYALAIRLRVLEERPRDEVAAALEVTPATFDVLLHRSLAALRTVLGQSLDGDLRGPS